MFIKPIAFGTGTTVFLPRLSLLFQGYGVCGAAILHLLMFLLYQEKFFKLEIETNAV